MTSPAANRRAIVHIGLNKTGSTTVQRWLQMNRAALRTRGIWFDDLPPHNGPELSTAMGWSIFAACADADWMPGPWQAQAYRIDSRATLEARVTRFLDRVEAGLPERAGTYVTSSEHMGSGLRKPEQIARLHGWFARRFDELRYVVYIREQADWVASAYVQAIRSGAVDDLDGFIDRHGRNDYFALVERWRAIVGSDALQVRRLDPAVLDGGDLITDFAARLGVDPEGLARPPRLNESMTAFRLRLTRSTSQRLGPLVTRLGLLPLQRRLYAMPMPNPFGLPKPQMTRKQLARVHEMNVDSNERLHAALFPDDPALFPSSRAAQAAPRAPMTRKQAAAHYGKHDAVVHIGMPKTGTGTIQAWLRDNRAALTAQGFVYPGFDEARGRKTGHPAAFGLIGVECSGVMAPDAGTRRLHGIDTPERQNQLVSGLSRQFDHYLADHAPGTVLVSSEWLSGWLVTEDRVRAFHDWMSERFATVRYVVYLRDQVSWFASAYAQQVKVGETATLDAFIARRPVRDYLKTCNIWHRGTGKRLTIRLLERDFLTDGDLLADYAGLIGADLSRTARTDPRNLAFSQPSVRLWRWVNARAAKKGWADRARLWRKTYARSPFAQMGRKLDLPEAKAREVAALNADKNAALRRKFFADRPYLFKRAHQILAANDDAATRDKVA